MADALGDPRRGPLELLGDRREPERRRGARQSPGEEPVAELGDQAEDRDAKSDCSTPNAGRPASNWPTRCSTTWRSSTIDSAAIRNSECIPRTTMRTSIDNWQSSRRTPEDESAKPGTWRVGRRHESLCPTPPHNQRKEGCRSGLMRRSRKPQPGSNVRTPDSNPGPAVVPPGDGTSAVRHPDPRVRRT